jgi:hypothetical protein
VYDRDGAEIPGYQGLIVTGRCGSTRANRVLPLDLQSWDGSDVFVREGTGEVYVTERVRNALEDARITNVAFEFVADAPSFAE